MENKSRNSQNSYISTNSSPKTLFHPSFFDKTSRDLPSNPRTLELIRQQREKRIESDDIKKLVSPGSFKLTVNDKKISQINTKQLFKNTYSETLLTFLFFSDKNVKNIQKLIKHLIYKEMGYIVDDQSYNELLTVMRSVFLQYSTHPPLITENMSEQERSALYLKYTKEVSKLNEIVINLIVPTIASQLQQYLDYLRDASNPPYYMDKPSNESVKGQRQYRSVTQVLTGFDL